MRHWPQHCPHCGSPDVKLHQAVRKNLSDPSVDEVSASRYRCLACRKTFRVYPPGVSRDRVTGRVKDLAILLYLLGFNGQAVSKALALLGQPLGASRIYDAIRAACQKLPEVNQVMFADVHTAMRGGDITGVKVFGRWAPLRIQAGASEAVVLSIEGLSHDDARALRARLEPVLGAVSVEARVAE
jgi:hypothetical protein